MDIKAKKTKDPDNMKKEQIIKKNQVRVYRFLKYWNQLIWLLLRLNLRDPCANAHGSTCVVSFLSAIQRINAEEIHVLTLR